MPEQRPPLRKCGGLWKPRPGSQSKGSGSITVGELKQKFIVVANDRKTKPEQPDYLILAQGEPEPDTYVREHPPAKRPAPEPDDMDVAF